MGRSSCIHMRHLLFSLTQSLAAWLVVHCMAFRLEAYFAVPPVDLWWQFPSHVHGLLKQILGDSVTLFLSKPYFSITVRTLQISRDFPLSVICRLSHPSFTLHNWHLGSLLYSLAMWPFFPHLLRRIGQCHWCMPSWGDQARVSGSLLISVLLDRRLFVNS